MGYYSIKDLEKFSGVKAHTIRIWEQRYQILNPIRTETNIRQYTDNDLKTILNVAILNKYGVKISHISSLSEPELKQKVLTTCANVEDKETEVDRLVIEMIDFNEVNFRQILKEKIKQFGVKNCFADLIYPFLEKIGLLWQIGTVGPAEEHLMSNVIRNLLIFETENLNVKTKADAKSYLLFLPNGEWHEIGLLLYAFILKERGESVSYLGASVPQSDVYESIDRLKPDFTCSCYVHTMSDSDLIQSLSDLAKKYDHITHMVTGYQVITSTHTFDKNVVVVRSIQEI